MKLTNREVRFRIINYNKVADEHVEMKFSTLYKFHRNIEKLNEVNEVINKRVNGSTGADGGAIAAEDGMSVPNSGTTAYLLYSDSTFGAITEFNTETKTTNVGGTMVDQYTITAGDAAAYGFADNYSNDWDKMNGYYAMVLVLDATGDTDIPEVLQQVTLSEEDALLTPEQKLDLAVSMVHDAEYYFQKGEIRRNLNECLAALKGSTYNSQESLADAARRAFVIVIILIVIQSLNIIAVLWLYNNLGISPLIKAAEHIGENESVPVAGAREFRYMAGAYNAMYETYRNSIANLNYKASHDKLTGVYNRAGYDFIKNNVDMTTTALMMVDGDKFKEINDNYGHDVGDLVLKKIADTLRKYFRSDDYVCRVGGDEFVVLMVHIPESPKVLIETKIDMINNDLQRTDDGVPAISLSIGIAYDPEGQEPDEMFRRADAALYHVKQNGRSGCCFYSDIT